MTEKYNKDDCGAFEISNEFYDGAGYATRLRYCPNCGAMVVDDE